MATRRESSAPASINWSALLPLPPDGTAQGSYPLLVVDGGDSRWHRVKAASRI